MLLLSASEQDNISLTFNMSSEQSETSMKNEIKYAVFDKRQSAIDSIIKDITSLAVLSLMVYVSHGSNWWTLVTGVMFIAWMAVKIGATTKERYKTFRTKEELVKWAESLD